MSGTLSERMGLSASYNAGQPSLTMRLADSGSARMWHITLTAEETLRMFAWAAAKVEEEPTGS